MVYEHLHRQRIKNNMLDQWKMYVTFFSIDSTMRSISNVFQDEFNSQATNQIDDTANIESGYARAIREK